jgi:adenine-specific DNA-methyltransferase
MSPSEPAPVETTLIASHFSKTASAVVYEGSCLDLLREIPDRSIKLVVTSPPYNLGKAYEQKLAMATYVEQQKAVIRECVRVLADDGSICWQVGNHVDRGAIVPLDIVLYPVFVELGLKLRNRIVWHFEHGLHCKNRFSGRYETINWFTRDGAYTFNLDAVRVPQKYPGKKHFKGPKAGQFSGNPLGKNPGDMWAIPNVKNNHVEKTGHPCQFPVELVERLVLALTRHGDWVLDPFVGVGSSIVAAVKHGRRGSGADVVPEYVQIARERTAAQIRGQLKTRPMQRPIYDPKQAGNALTRSPWRTTAENPLQVRLIEQSEPEYDDAR